MKNYVAFYSHLLKMFLAICSFFTAWCLDVRFSDLLCFICLNWSTIQSIAIFFAGRNCVDLVVVFNKRREETLLVSLQNRNSCVCRKYLILIPVNSCFYTRCKMHKTPVLFKNYNQNFLNKSNSAFVSFQNIFHLKKFYVMFMFKPWRLLEQYI